MEIQSALTIEPQQERGGEIALEGFMFQACWAIYEYLTKLDDNDEYTVVFEYHDDVLFIDSHTSPSSIDFTQVKKSSKKWTIDSLSKPKGKQTLSILAKLYNHILKFPLIKKRLLFVSNWEYNFKEGDCFTTSSLNIEERTLLESRLKQQLTLVKPIDFSLITLIKSTLSSEDSITHLSGKLIPMLKGDDGVLLLNPLLFAESLVAKALDRAKYKSSYVNNFDDLIEKKGITKNVISSLKDEILKKIQIEPEWNDVESFGDGIIYFTLEERLRIKAEFNKIGVLSSQKHSLKRKQKTDTLKFLHSKKCITIIEVYKASFDESTKQYANEMNKIELKALSAYCTLIYIGSTE